ncbi:MAG: alpha-amylase family glycosyl hydrolase [Bacteroidota bacterium]
MLRVQLSITACLFVLQLVQAQIVTTSPATPTIDGDLTIFYDATLGTAELADCNCDVYIHTGLITDQSDNSSDWQYVPTEWGEVNPDWQLQLVDGEDNLYSYTFSPSVAAYFGLPGNEEAQQLALVFRNGDGSLEGKDTGGSDIFVDLFDSQVFSSSLSLPVEVGALWPLGLPLDIQSGSTQAATLELYDNDVLVASASNSTQLEYTANYTTAGPHEIRLEAETPEGETQTQTWSFSTALVVEILDPEVGLIPAEQGENISYSATSYLPLDLSISYNGQNTTESGGSVDGNIQAPSENGISQLVISATHEGVTRADTLNIVVGGPTFQPAPAGLPRGITVTGPNSVHLQLYAPGKQDVFVIGNFSNWQPTIDARMKRGTDAGTFWIDLENIQVEDLLFQYLVDYDMQTADPHSTLVLDPFNDPFISEETFAGIPDYPQGGQGIVSWVRMDPPEYDWQIDNFEPTDEEDLVIYELLIRDFLDEHSFSVLQDTLEYLTRLGVNAVQFMPLNEFEGNISWGYNPSFHMALDKYYGSPEDFKALVDACHARGLAVIVDVVFNHAFSQSPLAQLWWDPVAFRPREDNPYLNVTARHPFNVGYDFNHESVHTQRYVKRAIRYYLEEYRVDGYRFDLSKGFTQTDYGDNVGAWSNYDAGRIAIIKDYADELWSVNPDAYMILEHLAVPQEEDELAQYGHGMYFWSGFNPHDAYMQSAMGFTSNSDIGSGLSENRGFSANNLISYIESHDEERLLYKTTEFGSMSGSYNTRELATGLDRSELAAVFFYTLPGPKMLWQFGELGYDFSINQCPGGDINPNCRVDPKPIRWDYRNDPDRQDLYNTIRSLLFLRNNYGTFHTDDIDYQLNGLVKRVHLEHPDFDASVLGNFDVVTRQIDNPFPSAGTWYDYFTGESIEITNPTASRTFMPGEYKLYLSEPIEQPTGGLGTTSAEVVSPETFKLVLSPNPTDGPIRAQFNLERAETVRLQMMDLSGRVVGRSYESTLLAGQHTISMEVDVPAGNYLLRFETGRGQLVTLPFAVGN